MEFFIRVHSNKTSTSSDFPLSLKRTAFCYDKMLFASVLEKIVLFYGNGFYANN